MRYISKELSEILENINYHIITQNFKNRRSKEHKSLIPWQLLCGQNAS